LFFTIRIFCSKRTIPPAAKSTPEFILLLFPFFF
jgi:hypothetical protein